MRVLLVVHGLPPRQVAGTEIYTLRLATILATEGHDVCIFAADDDPLRDPGSIRRRMNGAVSIVEFAASRVVTVARDAWVGDGARAAFEEELDAFRPDVVHIQHLNLLSFCVPEVASRRGTAVVMTLNDFSLICPRNGQLVRRDGSVCNGPEASICADCVVGYRFGLTAFERRGQRVAARMEKWLGGGVSRWARGVGLALRRISPKSHGARVLAASEGAGMLPVVEARAAAVAELVRHVRTFIAPSEFLERTFVAAGFRKESLVVLGYGVDTESHSAAGAGYAPGERLRVGFLGTVSPQKGIDLIVEAMQFIPDGLVEVDVFGREDLRPEFATSLRRRARGLPIRFHGKYQPSRVGEILASVDVTVVPSRWVENQPITILEAQAHGVPVVTADLGGMRELVRDGVNGRLFRPGDAGSLAAVLGDLARDRGQVERLRTQVRRPATLGEHAKRIVAIYRTAIESGERA